MSSGQRIGGSVVASVAAAAAVLASAPPAGAVQTWNGRWEMVVYFSQKTGTSPAARQWESDSGGVFNVSTDCSSGQCVATAVGGPKPSNRSIPQPYRFSWNGTNWTSGFDWLWNCYLGDGPHKLLSPATSWIFYEPQADGFLKGTWHTDIASGPCRGSVVMPIAAYPR
ncbi:MAG: hypothetical protein ACR2JM_11870 [Mycobacterium sp.]